MRIELTRRGDYAVRAMVTLARPGAGQLTAGSLARATGIPENYVPQVMGDLVRAGLVANRRGRRGGYRLGRRAPEVSLLDVVEAVEGDGRRRTCVLRGGPCRGDPRGPCDVHDAFFRAQEGVFATLAGVSLADVAGEGTERVSLAPMPATPPVLLLSPVFEAFEDWLVAPDEAATASLGRAILRVGERMGLRIGEIRVHAPPLPELVVNSDEPVGTERPLGARGESGPIGSIRVEGDESQASALAHALGVLFVSAQARSEADRSAAQLRAVEVAIRGIGGVLDRDRVLQVIVDRVRELVQAKYAALGIVDREGTIEQFITSGISDEERERIGALPRGRGLLGLIIREARTYRIRDITTHPDRYGFPPNHPEMHSFLGVPIRAHGEAIGRFYLTEKQGAGEFSEDDEALVEMFALHAGIAIDNARLHDQVRRLAVVDERDRISRDLHDSVIQAIYAQTLALDDVPDLVADDPDEARERVDEAIDALHAVIRDIRNFIFGLRPVLLESGSLAEGLAHLATELRRSGGIEVAVSIQNPTAPSIALPIEAVAELLAVTREALSNIARHAHASRASVTLDESLTELRLEITDDGRGFDAGRLVDRGHHGLANMRSRTEAIGGRFEIDSAASGTRIIIALPRPSAAIEGAAE